jgi:hypothetical protein
MGQCDHTTSRKQAAVAISVHCTRSLLTASETFASHGPWSLRTQDVSGVSDVSDVRSTWFVVKETVGSAVFYRTIFKPQQLQFASIFLLLVL